MTASDTVRRALKSCVSRLPDIFRPGERLVVGFSGGQDSTCLLHALATSRFSLELVAAHVDHSLRAESAEAAHAAAALAADIGVPAEIERVDVGGYRKSQPGWTVQQAARAARYQALAAVAQRHQAGAVLVAHTADDQAETVLLNLLRGAGLTGLAGMRLDDTLDLVRLGPPLEERPASTVLRVARPLLRVSRATTQAYCAELGLTIVEDASNQSRAYTRNRVRLDLLPVLERFNPAIRSVLARTADLAAEDLAALESILDVAYSRVVRREDPSVVEFDLPTWRSEPRAMQRRLLRRGLDAILGGLVDVRASPVEDALDLLRSGQTGQTYHLPDGVELCLQPTSFIVRLHGRALPRTRANTWGSQHPRV